jgi:hypothetical protein
VVHQLEPAAARVRSGRVGLAEIGRIVPQHPPLRPRDAAGREQVLVGAVHRDRDVGCATCGAFQEAREAAGEPARAPGYLETMNSGEDLVQVENHAGAAAPCRGGGPDQEIR